MNLHDADEALAQAIESGRLDGTTSFNPEITKSYSTYQKVESLFELLRLPPELAALAGGTGSLPARIGRYSVIKLLGHGGFGQVYLAYDELLDRQVAIKVAPAHRANLLHDARKAAGLRHDGIVTIHAVEETPDGSFFVVMEYFEGGSLADRIKAGEKMPPIKAARLVTDIAKAVQHAHERGLVHRDIKPDNILLDGDGRPHVADFGLAVHESAQADLAGDVSGTPGYMSPEQIRGDAHRIDGRTDVWSLGAVLYELLTGRRPYSGRTREELFDEILHREPKPPRQIDPSIPPKLQDVVLRCLNKDASQRYASAADVADALRRAVKKRRKIPPILVLVISLSLLVAIVPLAMYQRVGVDKDVALSPNKAPSQKDNKTTSPSEPSPHPPIQSAAVKLGGTLDVAVWRPNDENVRGAPIQKAGIAPLRVGDQYRIQVELSRPAFVYLVSIDADGKVHIVHPWIPERGDKRPAKETPVLKVESPSEGDAQGWPVTAGRAGTTTVLLLARETRLPDDVDLAALLSDVGSPPLRESEPVAFFNQGKMVSQEQDRNRGTRSASFIKSQPIDDPLLQYHSRLAKLLRPHSDLIRAISYADLGK